MNLSDSQKQVLGMLAGGALFEYNLRQIDRWPSVHRLLHRLALLGYTNRVAAAECDDGPVWTWQLTDPGRAAITMRRKEASLLLQHAQRKLAESTDSDDRRIWSVSVRIWTDEVKLLVGTT